MCWRSDRAVAKPTSEAIWSTDRLVDSRSWRARSSRWAMIPLWGGRPGSARERRGGGGGALADVRQGGQLRHVQRLGQVLQRPLAGGCGGAGLVVGNRPLDVLGLASVPERRHHTAAGGAGGPAAGQGRLG